MRHRASALLGLTLALTLASCDGSTANLPATAGCLAAERQPVQEGGHLLGDAPPPVPYSSVPPSSGWHASGTGPAPGAYGEPVSEPALVLWLEKGGIAVAYAPELADAQVRELSLLPSEVEGILVTPYEPAMPSPIALVAWGVLQRCETVDAAAVQAFADAHGYQDRSD